ncbi:hypothetical protein KI387_008940, partial [Taxus chinensis]
MVPWFFLALQIELHHLTRFCLPYFLNAELDTMFSSMVFSTLISDVFEPLYFRNL